MRENFYWWVSEMNFKNSFDRQFLERSRSKFRFSREARAALAGMFAQGLAKIGVKEVEATLVERFMSRGFVDSFYDTMEQLKR